MIQVNDLLLDRIVQRIDAVDGLQVVRDGHAVAGTQHAMDEHLQSRFAVSYDFHRGYCTVKFHGDHVAELLESGAIVDSPPTYRVYYDRETIELLSLHYDQGERIREMLAMVESLCEMADTILRDEEE